uniref:Uncharacterized protein n=1 Tax=viral metagenome TaxID=1070528 RepID=A0A6C0J1I2_9ZZZZ
MLNSDNHSNPLVEFLELNKGTTYSTKTIAKLLKLRRPKVTYYKNLEIDIAKNQGRKSKFICPKPITIGSGKYYLDLLKYND